MEARLAQSGTERPFILKQEWAHRWPWSKTRFEGHRATLRRWTLTSKWWPYILWQVRQADRQAPLGDEMDAF